MNLPTRFPTPPNQPHPALTLFPQFHYFQSFLPPNVLTPTIELRHAHLYAIRIHLRLHPLYILYVSHPALILFTQFHYFQSFPPPNATILTYILFSFISTSITLHNCTSRISLLSPFHNFATSNLPTLYTVLAYLHFKLPNKDLPFAFRFYPLSLNVLFSFSLIFAPSPSLWALLPTTHTY